MLQNVIRTWGRSANINKDSDSDGGRDECTLNLLAAGSGGADRNPEEVGADCVVLENSVSREREGTQGDGDHSDKYPDLNMDRT